MFYNGLMWKRFILTALLAGLPVTVSADAGTGADIQPGGGGGGVQGAPTNPGAGGSSADGSALQPANPSGLGSAPTDSANLVAPVGNPLQASSPSSDQLQVLRGEADGAPQTPSDAGDTADPWLAGLLMSVFVILAGIGWWIRRQQLIRAHARYAHHDA